MNKIIVAVLGVNTLLAAAALALPLLRASAGAPATAEAEGAEATGHADNGDKAAPVGAGKDRAGEPGPGPMVSVDNIVVHLRNPEMDRYARVAFNVELSKPDDLASFQSALPRVRDAMISLLSDRTAEQLAGSAGLKALKDDVTARTSAVIGEGHVRGVYITDFVVQ